MTNSRSAATTTAVTLVPSARALSLAACHTSSGTRTALSGVATSADQALVSDFEAHGASAEESKQERRPVVVVTLDANCVDHRVHIGTGVLCDVGNCRGLLLAESRARGVHGTTVYTASRPVNPPICPECGNDETAHGMPLCLDCMEVVA